MKVKASKLNKAEKRRIETAATLIQKMTLDGYYTEEITIGSLYANVMAFVYCLPLVLFFILLYRIKGGHLISDYLRLPMSAATTVFVVSLVLIAVHELIHGYFMWKYTGKKKNNIYIGFNVRALMPYCTCQVPMTKYKYIISLLAPTFFLGILPSIVACIIQSPVLAVIGLLMIIGGGGDIIIANKIRKIKDFQNGKRIVILDHPTKCGFYYFHRDNQIHTEWKG